MSTDALAHVVVVVVVMPINATVLSTGLCVIIVSEVHTTVSTVILCVVGDRVTSSVSFIVNLVLIAEVSKGVGVLTHVADADAYVLSAAFIINALLTRSRLQYLSNKDLRELVIAETWAPAEARLRKAIRSGDPRCRKFAGLNYWIELHSTDIAEVYAKKKSDALIEGVLEWCEWKQGGKAVWYPKRCCGNGVSHSCEAWRTK